MSAPLLDMNFGLRCVAGNEALFRRLLDKFADQHAEDAAKIASALDAGDRESAPCVPVWPIRCAPPWRPRADSRSRTFCSRKYLPASPCVPARRLHA